MTAHDTIYFRKREHAENIARLWEANSTPNVTHNAAVYPAADGTFYVKSGYVCSGGCSPMREVTRHEAKELLRKARPQQVRLATTPEDIAKLDDEAVRLRYRQLVARLHATGRGGDELVALRDAFHAEALKRNLI